MSRIVNKLSTAAAALVLSVGLAVAQAPQPAQAPPAATPPPAAVTKDVAPVKKSTSKKKAGPAAQAERTPESLACSAELDAKNIHGKQRAAALRKCKADAKKGKAAATPAAAKK